MGRIEPPGHDPEKIDQLNNEFEGILSQMGGSISSTTEAGASLKYVYDMLRRGGFSLQEAALIVACGLFSGITPIPDEE